MLLGPRTFPVVITGMTIVEQRFDPALFPLRAEVDLRMRILEVGENAATARWPRRSPTCATSGCGWRTWRR